MADENKDAKEANQYRFSGYQPPLVALDGSGPAYWVAEIHPYYRNQPEWWSQRATYCASESINPAQDQKLFFGPEESNGQKFSFIPKLK